MRWSGLDRLVVTDPPIRVSPGKVSVVIADDHPRQRALLRRGLESNGFQVLDDVPDANSALDSVLHFRPAVVLLDIHMPGNGLVAAERITQARPETTVIMLTVSEDADDLFNALRAGAHGYLSKSLEPTELADQIRRVMAGDIMLPQRVVNQMLETLTARRRRRVFPRKQLGRSLSDRQDDILRRLARSTTPEAVAADLGLDVAVVHSELAVIISNLRVRSADELTTLLQRD